MSHALMAVRRGRRNVVLLRLRRPIREKPNIRLPYPSQPSSRNPVRKPGYLHFGRVQADYPLSSVIRPRRGDLTAAPRPVIILVLQQISYD